MRDFVVSIFFVERTIALDLRNIEKDPEANEGWFKIGLFEEITKFASEDDAFDGACEIIPWLNKNL